MIFKKKTINDSFLFCTTKKYIINDDEFCHKKCQTNTIKKYNTIRGIHKYRSLANLN